MVERIQKIIDYYKLTSSAFADKIGVPRSSISHLLSGRNNPSLDFVYKTLSVFPQVQTDWLIFGSGSMLKGNSTLFPDEKFEDLQEFEITTENDISDDHQEDVGNLAEKAISFAHDPAPRKERASVGESPVEFENIVRSEEQAEYLTNSNRDTGRVSRVLVLYNDGTFLQYREKSQNKGFGF